jgi:ketosteroid isomerase-like protein
MKAFLCVCYLVIVLNASGWAIKTPEIQAGQTLHETWELAFERANINAVEELWARNPDVLLVTPLGTRHKGFASVKAALKNVFELFGQTKLDVSERFLTLNGNEASITTTYRWSPAENVVFRSTEHLTKIHDQWKIQIADAQGNLLPLRLLEWDSCQRQLSNRCCCYR